MLHLEWYSLHYWVDSWQGKNFCLDHVLRRTESRAWDSARLMLGSISPGLASDPVHFKAHFSSTGTSGPDAARASYSSTTSGPAAACSQQVEPALWAIKIFLDVIPTSTTTQHRSNNNNKKTGTPPSKPQNEIPQLVVLSANPQSIQSCSYPTTQVEVMKETDSCLHQP